jgi:hypothetical protein
MCLCKAIGTGLPQDNGVCPQGTERWRALGFAAGFLCSSHGDSMVPRESMQLSTSLKRAIKNVQAAGPGNTGRAPPKGAGEEMLSNGFYKDHPPRSNRPGINTSQQQKPRGKQKQQKQNQK